MSYKECLEKNINRLYLLNSVATKIELIVI